MAMNKNEADFFLITMTVFCFMAFCFGSLVYAGAWKDLEKAYRQGKVRALGISNFDNWSKAFHDIVDDMEIKPAIFQIECHPFAQRRETRELAAEYGIQIEC